jgi:HSP20 family protein
MQVTVGDRIVVESERVSRPPRTGRIEEVLSVDPPRFRVRWDNGRVSNFAPTAGAVHVDRGRTAGRGRGAGGTRTRPFRRQEGGIGMSQQLLPERRAESAGERWEPANELELMTERMRRLLDQTFGGLGWPTRTTERDGWSPLVDIEEEDDAYVIEADVPGVRPEDVDIELVGNELTISGRIEERERKGVVRRRTRRTGRFEFRVTLPDQVDPDKVEAKLAEGVLTVRVPKTEKAQRRRVEIATG